MIQSIVIRLYAIVRGYDFNKAAKELKEFEEKLEIYEKEKTIEKKKAEKADIKNHDL